MSSISDKTIQAVKNVNILTVAEGLGYDLNKKNKDTFKIKCIHPGDNEPSLVLYPETNSFNCFGCHKSGDNIGLVMFIKNMTYTESVEFIANIIDLKIIYNNETKESNDFYKELKKYHKDLDEKWVLDFLSNRNIDQNDINKWQLGYIKGKHKLVIPIYMLNKLRGFAYRNLINKPKYFYDVRNEHSVSTGLLYGLDIARKIYNKDFENTCVLVEGYFDAIQLNKYSIPAVALMGCHMTVEQKNVLQKAFKHFIIFMDGDPAGENAMKSISFMLPGSQVICFDGDPDDLAISLKDDLANYILENKISFSAYKINKLLSQANSKIDDIKLRTLTNAQTILNSMPSTEKEYYTNIIIKQLNIDKKLIK